MGKHRFGEWRTGGGEWRNGENNRQTTDKKRPARPALKGFAVHTATWSCSAQPHGAKANGKNLVPILEATG